MLAAPFHLTGCSKSDQGKDMVETFLIGQHMRTVRAGRFTINMPGHFDLQPLSEVQLFFGLQPEHVSYKIQFIGETLGGITARSAATKRATDFKEQHHHRSSSNTMLAAFRELSDDVFAVWSYVGVRITDAIRVEIYKTTGDAVFRYVGVASELRSPDELQSKLQEISLGATTSDASSPSVRGVCLHQLSIEGSWDGEVVTTAFKSSRWPDVILELGMNSLIQNFDGSLLKRWSSKSSGFGAAGFSVGVLRQRAITMAGAKAEELLTDGREHGKIRRDFDAETVPSPFSKLSPQIRLGLRMGGQVGHEYVDPSISESESMALWDALIGSITLRPVAV
jgi:Tle cognate immunity protein 4 C-terminal domain